MSVTDEIKARLDIVEFIQDYVPLKKAGRNYKGLCPFHSEKTPSFVVFPDSQNWRCFGACGEGGDIFSFVMKREGWDFGETLRFLAQRAGVELEPYFPQQAEAQEAYERLRELLSDAALYFNSQLLSAPYATHALSYVEARGLSAETIESFGLGYAPNSWDATTAHLMEKEYERQDLIDAGLLVVREDDRTYDRFRDRLMIPIRDVQGRVIGFGARALARDAVPKYLNSPQSKLFDKSRTLFGLSHARRTIREGETAVIVEGYMDVMQAHQAGFTNVVAEMGTALTEPQLQLLARYANRLILALDPDVAGQMATDRGREVVERVSRAAAEQIGEEGIWGFDKAEREYHTRLTTEFDARGMVRYESRLGFDIRVIVLPHGKDPDELIRESPDAWANLVAGSLPVVEYAIQKAIEGQELDDPKVKSQIARQITPLINDVANAVERSHYRQRLARLLRVEELALFPERRGHPARPRAYSAPLPPPQGGGSEQPSALSAASPSPLEAFCLAALIRYPQLIYRANRVLAECLSAEHLPDNGEGTVWAASAYLVPYVSVSDFSHPEHRVIFQTWLAALAQDEQEPVDYLLQTLDDLPLRRVQGWLKQPLEALLRNVQPVRTRFESSEGRAQDVIIQRVLALRERRVAEYLQELEFRLHDAHENGDLTPGESGDTISVHAAARAQLQRAHNQFSLSGR